MATRIHSMPAMPLLADPPPWNALARSEAAPASVGRSVLGNTISIHGARQANVMLMAGVHGDESEGIFLSHLLVQAGCPVPVLACLNPDGAFLRQRWNARNVDLNRNLPAPDWNPEALNPRYPPGPAPGSEPETQAFLAALERVGPSTVVSLHSYRESFIEIERAAETLPDAINAAVEGFVKAVGIERRLSIGYPTPGALGAYGLNNGLLVLTYELQRGSSHEDLHGMLPHLQRLLESLEASRFEAG